MEDLKTNFMKEVERELKHEDKEYKERLLSTINNLESIFKNKKPRKRRIKENHKKEEEVEEDEISS